MKIFYKCLILAILLSSTSVSSVFAKDDYKNNAIIIYNSGAVLQQQHKYELAEQKYNQVLKLQPDFVEAKNNLSIIYCKKSEAALQKKDYVNSIAMAKTALAYNSKNQDAYQALANTYEALNSYVLAADAYNKILAISPNDDCTLHALAQLYVKAKRYSKASEIYQKLLRINPEDAIARQNLKYVDSQLAEKIISKSLNGLSPKQNAPEDLYALVRPSAGVGQDKVERFKTILDVVWNDPSGKILLQAILEQKIPINISPGEAGANATSTRKDDVFYDEQGVVIIDSDFSGEINIPQGYISNFFNQRLTSYQRIYSLHAPIHEFVHAFMSIKNPNNINSLEEEMGASMIGYNIAMKAITGKYMTADQTEKYSGMIRTSLLSDTHSTLPEHSHFTKIIQSCGIILPYPEVWE